MMIKLINNEFKKVGLLKLSIPFVVFLIVIIIIYEFNDNMKNTIFSLISNNNCVIRPPNTIINIDKPTVIDVFLNNTENNIISDDINNNGLQYFTYLIMYVLSISLHNTEYTNNINNSSII